jgi:phospholipase C
MTTPLEQIETVVVLMMENRSFDQVLGYLSLPPHNRTDIEGLRPPGPYTNTYQGKSYGVFPMNNMPIPVDPPHDRKTITQQIGTPKELGAPYPMDGFIQSYMETPPAPPDPSVVMGYYRASDVPIYDFFAKHFAICDHWFSALPSGTQPNRLMAMAGESRLQDNGRFLLPAQELVYDWLLKRDIPWRTYYCGKLPFFALMHKWQLIILEDLVVSLLGRQRHFRKFKKFEKDWQSNKPLPNVLFIEPNYTDILDSFANDDHPPTPMSQGQAFVRSLYETLLSNPKRWEKTMLVITYDEHGGFYDHVPPPNIPTESPTPDDEEAYPPFETVGPRVPAFVISPYVTPGSVFKEPLDHTSVLALLAERFDLKKSYSPAVDIRQGFLGKLSGVLQLAAPRKDCPKPPTIAEAFPLITPLLPDLHSAANPCTNTQAFRSAMERMEKEHPNMWKEYEVKEKAER